MSKNYLQMYAEQLAAEIELLCQNIKAPANTLFQIRKSSSSVYANICEANYGQSKADMLSKFEIPAFVRKTNVVFFMRSVPSARSDAAHLTFPRA